MKEIRDSVFSFSKDNPPAAHCADGEIVKFLLPDGFGGRIRSEQDLVTDFEGFNPVAGPLYVDGAEPGDAIGVEILDIQTADHGAIGTVEGLGPLWDSCELRTHIIPIRDGRAEFHQVRWQIDPMIGTMGCALADRDVESTFVFEGGGNMDSRRIRRGATVWFPVRVPGALLAMGDMHASMGDGENCGTGIEIAGSAVVKIRICHDFLLNWPLTETSGAYYVNTCGATSDEAITRGYQEMQRLISRAYGWDMTDAALYMSMQGFVEANQACIADSEGGDTFRVGTPKLPGKRGIVFSAAG